MTYIRWKLREVVSWEPRNTVVTILASHTGGPGFDSRTGHDFFFRLRTVFCLSFYSHEPSWTNNLVKSASGTGRIASTKKQSTKAVKASNNCAQPYQLLDLLAYCTLNTDHMRYHINISNFF